jgi:hypothetical protein
VNPHCERSCLEEDRRLHDGGMGGMPPARSSRP